MSDYDLSLYHSILLCNNDVLKISDFGVSRHFGEKSMKMTFVGTVGWMSPETSCAKRRWTSGPTESCSGRCSCRRNHTM